MTQRDVTALPLRDRAPGGPFTDADLDRAKVVAGRLRQFSFLDPESIDTEIAWEAADLLDALVGEEPEPIKSRAPRGWRSLKGGGVRG